ncbi:MAG: hypothetical protein IPK77_14400 [Cellvibrio sp.]|nr:hypothetical protein [Cellvibrio sp.]
MPAVVTRGGNCSSPWQGGGWEGVFSTSLSVFLLLISMQSFAKEESSAESTNIATASSTDSTAEKKPAEKKMVSEANISLRTTVTGNQEQPLVMYILPWQSPDSPEFDLEMQSSQADAVFGHMEREELNRQLDSAGELDEEDN